MIVKELIEQCPVETVVSEVLTLCCVDENEQTSVRGSYTAFVENLKKRQAVETEHLLLGIKDIEETKEKIEILLYACKDLHRFLSGDPPRIDVAELDAFSPEDMEQLLERVDLPKENRFEFSPWNEVLGYKLDSQNLNDIGSLKFVAAIVYEMTFWGFTEEEAEAERKRLQEAVGESMLLQNYSLEKEEKHSLREVLKKRLLAVAAIEKYGTNTNCF